MADLVAEYYNPYTGILQVSAGLLGFVCRRSGTGTTRSRIGGNTTPSTAIINVSGTTYPIVAVRADNYGMALSGKSVNGEILFACAGRIGTAFTYYVFDWTPSLPDTPALMRLWREDGTLSFSSSYWPMKVMNSMLVTEDQQYPKFTAPGKSLAVAMGNIGGHSRSRTPACYDGGQTTPQLGGPDELENCRDIRDNVDGKLYGGAIVDSGQSVQVDYVSYDDVFGRFGSYTDYINGYAGGYMSPNRVLSIDVTGIPIGRTFF